LQRLENGFFDLAHDILIGDVRITPPKMKIDFILREQSKPRSIICPVSVFFFHLRDPRLKIAHEFMVLSDSGLLPIKSLMKGQGKTAGARRPPPTIIKSVTV
jgi:hypothetical protein